jgi:hypothetical protein
MQVIAKEEGCGSSLSVNGGPSIILTLTLLETLK